MKALFLILASLVSFTANALTVTIAWQPPVSFTDGSLANPTDVQYSTLKCGTASGVYSPTAPWTVDVYPDANGFVGTSTLVITDLSITRGYCAVSFTGQSYTDANGVLQPGLESTDSFEINFDPHTRTFVVPGTLSAPGTPIVTITQ